ncbi:MAG: biotin--[acetyl-CoA-carboxylase] ligase [Candidatus Kaelpia aquatica]|nr:biotin--[acetyl-CoA-carboxylase] ligase [Candidatus Kaelpia aquatica]
MSKKLDRIEIKKRIKAGPLASELVVLDSIGSTQDYIFENSDSLKDGAVIVAESQSNGYGRMGRVWNSSYGKGLYMSVLFKGGLAPSRYSGLTMLGSLSLCRYLSLEYGFDFKMRWPNDVMFEGNKLAGVLANMRDGIIGLGFGVNINQDLSELPDMATSIFLLSGEEVDRNIFIPNFLNSFQKDLGDWEEESFRHLRKLWLDFALLKGKEITASTSSGIIKGTVEDITEDCGLIIRGDMGYKVVLSVAELIKIR